MFVIITNNKELVIFLRPETTSYHSFFSLNREDAKTKGKIIHNSVTSWPLALSSHGP